MRPRAAAVTAGCARTAASVSAGAISLSSISSATGVLGSRRRAGAALGRVGQEYAAPAHGVAKLAQHADACVPADARIGDTDSVFEGLAGKQVLPPGIDVTFEHHADDAIVAARDLAGNIARDLDLTLVLLLAVRMRAIDHHPRRKPGVSQLAADLVDACRIVVGRPPAAQDDVAILVARRMHDGGVTAFGYRQEVVRRGGCLDGIDRDLHSAVGAVLEPDRTRQARRELTVNLAFGGACHDRPPRDQIGDVLRGDHIEVLGTGGQLELVDLEQDAPTQPQAFVDAKAVVKPWVVDQTLPADGRSGLEG